MRRLLATAALLSLPLAGCNTISGIGKDLQSIGDALTQSSDDARTNGGDDSELCGGTDASRRADC